MATIGTCHPRGGKDAEREGTGEAAEAEPGCMAAWLLGCLAGLEPAVWPGS